MKYWTYLHAVLPGVSKINHKFVNFAHSNGLKVYCWTANSFGSIKKLIRMDVDGITTDYPLRVYEAIEQEYPELREEEDFL
jgi:glycerophosphoryl diester phosphodiesterase